MARRHMVLGATVLVVLAVALVVFARQGSDSSSQTPSEAGTAHGATPASRAALATLTGGSFTTPYPASWKLSTAQGVKARRYALSSTGAALGSAGIGPAGTVGVTIGEVHLPAAYVRMAGGTSGEEQLMERIVGVPRAAVHVTRTLSPRPTSLAGVPAVEESFSYTHAARSNVQADVLVRRGAQALVVELDGEPGFAQAQESAFEQLLRSWRWR